MIVLYGLLAIVGVAAVGMAFLSVCALAVDPHKTYDRHSRFYRRVLNGATAIGLRMVRIRIHVSGTEKIPPNTRKLLFVSNHRSNFDPIVTWYCLRDWDIAFISKKENFRIPIFGRIIRRCCFLQIDREDPRKAMTTVRAAAQLLEREEVSIGVYPEGTRSRTCELLPFHNGVFKIAQKAGAQVVVLAVSGTERIHRNFPLHHTDVYLDVSEVIDARQVQDSRTAELGKRARADIAECLDRNARQTM